MHILNLGYVSTGTQAEGKYYDVAQGQQQHTLTLGSLQGPRLPAGPMATNPLPTPQNLDIAPCLLTSLLLTSLPQRLYSV